MTSGFRKKRHKARSVMVLQEASQQAPEFLQRGQDGLCGRAGFVVRPTRDLACSSKGAGFRIRKKWTMFQPGAYDHILKTAIDCQVWR
jgi:hypothetical protein